MKRILLLSVLIILILLSCAKANNIPESVLEIEHFFPTQGYVRDICIANGRLYAAQDQTGFSVYDLSDNSEIIHYNQDLDLAKLIEVSDYDSLLFVYDMYGSPGSIVVYDISNFAAVVDTFTIQADTDNLKGLNILSQNNGSIDMMWTTGNKLKYSTLVKGDYISWIAVADIEFSNPIEGFDVNEDFSFVASEQLGFYINDVETGENISITNTTGEALAVKAVDNFLFVALRQEGFAIYDISDPVNPQFLSDYDTFGYAQSVDVENDLLAIASGGGGVYLFDISNKNEPAFLDRIDDSKIGYTYKVLVVGGKVYAATRNGVYEFVVNL